MTGFGRTTTVLSCVADPKLRQVIRAAARGASAKVAEAECSTDLIGIPSFLAVVDPSCVDEAGWKAFRDYLIESEDHEYKVLLTGVPRHTGRLPTVNLVKCPGLLSPESLRFLMLRARAVVMRRRKAWQKKERQILRIVWMLRRFDLGRTVTVQGVCGEFAVTPRTVQRDLDLLAMAGYPLEVKGKGRYALPRGMRSGDLL